jgi:hypothetical protein
MWPRYLRPAGDDNLSPMSLTRNLRDAQTRATKYSRPAERLGDEPRVLFASAALFGWASLVDGPCGLEIHLDSRVVTQPRLAQRMQILTTHCVEVAGGEDVIETAPNPASLALPVPTEPALWRDLILVKLPIHISKVKLRKSLEHVTFANVPTFNAVFMSGGVPPRSFNWCLAGRIIQRPRH